MFAGTLVASQIGPRAFAWGPTGSPGIVIGRVLPAATYLFAVLLVLGDCSGSVGGSNPERPVQTLESPVQQQTPASEMAPLSLRLEAPSEVRAGESVPLRLVLVNPGPEPVTVDLGGDPTAFDFLIVASDGTAVWRRLEGVAVEDILVPRTVDPDSSIRFTATWPQRDNDGRQVGPGGYRVTGILPVVGTPGGWVTEAQTVVVLP